MKETVVLAEVGQVDYYPGAFNPRLGLWLSRFLVARQFGGIARTVTTPAHIPLKIADGVGWNHRRQHYTVEPTSLNFFARKYIDRLEAQVSGRI